MTPENVQSPGSEAPDRPGTARYAPSPTGHFHLGNLRTALIAWLCARSQGQRFLLRIEDLDPDRSRPEYERSQLEDLRALGIDWDCEPVRQSERHGLYLAAFDRLVADDLAYPCFCSRKEIAEASQAPHEGEAIYPGTCSALSPSDARNRADSGDPHSWRIRAEAAETEFSDLRHGLCRAPVDDFVLIRRDGVPAYHLAVVVDDDAQGVTEIVRGDDLLLPTTARHAFLYDALGLVRPDWRHVPLVLDEDGNRLAKRDRPWTRVGYLDADGTDAQLLATLVASLGIADAPGVSLGIADAPGVSLGIADAPAVADTAAGEVAANLQQLASRFDPSTLNTLGPWAAGASQARPR